MFILYKRRSIIIILLIVLVIYVIAFFKLLYKPKVGMIVWAIAYIGVMYISYSVAADLLRMGSRIIDYAYIPGLFPATGFVACLIKHIVNKFNPKKAFNSESGPDN